MHHDPLRDAPAAPAGVGTRSRRPGLVRALAVAAGIAAGSLVVVAIELGLRLERAGTLRVKPFFAPDSLLIYRLNPSIAEYRTSFRGAGPSSDGSPPLVVCLGGSTTFGTHVREADAWPRRLEARLREVVPNARALNAGVPGYGSRQLALRYTHQVAALGPRYVVLYEGWNGAGALVDPGGHVPAVAPRPGAGAAARGISRLARHSLLVRAVTRKSPGPWRMDPYHDVWEADMLQLTRAIAAAGQRPVVVIYPALYHEGMSGSDAEAYRGLRLIWPFEPGIVDDVRRKHASLRRIAAETGALLVEAHDSLAGLSGASRAGLFVDEMHLTPPGHERVAGLIAGVIAADLAAGSRARRRGTS